MISQGKKTRLIYENTMNKDLTVKMWKRNGSFSGCIQETRYESCIENF